MLLYETFGDHTKDKEGATTHIWVEPVMAAPLISGCAALIREYYLKNKNHKASAALLKATLINSTRWLKASDAVAEYDTLPNFHQGFGCIHMPWAIPNPSEPKLRLEFGTLGRTQLTSSLVPAKGSDSRSISQIQVGCDYA